MSLSFQFRDFVFMRLVKALVKHRVFKNRNVTSSVAYIVNMLIMGSWHGLTWYYITYGLLHGTGLAINDAWMREKKKINRGCKVQDLSPLPDNKWAQTLGISIALDVVILSFLLFLSLLDQS